MSSAKDSTDELIDDLRALSDTLKLIYKANPSKALQKWLDLSPYTQMILTIVMYIHDKDLLACMEDLLRNHERGQKESP